MAINRTDDEILAAYLEGNKLKVLPSKRSKKLIVLRWLVQRFERGRRYPESNVNSMIAQSYPDYATLRRELCDNYLLDRANGEYWRHEAADTVTGP